MEPARTLRWNIGHDTDHVVNDSRCALYLAAEYPRLIARDVPRSNIFGTLAKIDGINGVIWRRVALPDLGVEDLSLGAGVIRQAIAASHGAAEPG